MIHEKRGKYHSVLQFSFDQASPVNDEVYRFKTLDVVFAEETNRVVVVTVKVYYHND